MASTPDTAGTLRDELRDDAQTVADSATQRLHGEIDSRKGDAASQVQSVSSALGSTARELGQDSPQWLKSALEQGAQTLDRLARSVNQKNSRQLTRDVQQLARENPGTFLAGCALAGFAAARVFKAGAAEGSTNQGSFDPAAAQSYTTQAVAPDPAQTQAAYDTGAAARGLEAVS